VALTLQALRSISKRGGMSKAAKAIRRYAEGYRIVPHTGRATNTGPTKKRKYHLGRWL